MAGFHFSKDDLKFEHYEEKSRITGELCNLLAREGATLGAGFFHWKPCQWKTKLPYDEVLYFVKVDGKFEITFEGKTIAISQGDVCHFTKGTVLKFDVEGTATEYYVTSDPYLGEAPPSIKGGSK